MRRLLLLGLWFAMVSSGCSKVSAKHEPVCEELWALLIERTQEHLPEVEWLKGGGGGTSGADSAFVSQFEHVLESQGPVEPARHEMLAQELYADALVWLEQRGADISGEGQDESGCAFEFRRDQAVGFVFIWIVRIEGGALAVHLAVAEHQA